MSNLRRLLILILLVSSCATNSNILIYSGNNGSSTKVFTVLKACKLPVQISHKSRDVSLVLGESRHRESYDLILGLIKPYLSYGGRSSALEIKDFFIPKRGLNLTSEGFPNQFIEDLINSPNILEVRTQVDALSGKHFILLSLVDVPTLKTEVDDLLNNLQKQYNLILNGENLRFNVISVSAMLNFQDISYSTLTILEPFSFHVLKSEKTLAGVQFLMLLILFLLSGFILGLWWKGRDIYRRSKE